jgi:hypothetical protein
MSSEAQLAQLRSFPDIGRDDLIRYFTLTQADMAFVDPGRGRGPADRLGLAVQLCTLGEASSTPESAFITSKPPRSSYRFVNTAEPTTAPRIPPMIGPTTGTQLYCQSEVPFPGIGKRAWAMRGLRSRAGLIA